MSALPQPQLERRTEGDLLRNIGQIANTATSELAGFKEIIEIALSFPGMRKAKIEDSTLLTVVGPIVWPATANRGKGHATWVNVDANGRSWGRLRLTADVTARSIAGVESFARFLGQQLALLLNRLDLIRELHIRRAQAKRLSERLEARKNLQRASGLVAKTRGVSSQQALRLLVSHARKSRRTLNRVAETVLLGYEAPLTSRPILRRIQPGEFTRPRAVTGG